MNRDVAFGGKSKETSIYLELFIVKFLAQKTGAGLVYCRSWRILHDTALPSGDDYNYLKIKK